jgi:hypothetical protein
MRRIAGLASAAMLAVFALPAFGGACQDREAQSAANRYDTQLRIIASCLGDAQNDSDPLVVAFDEATPDTSESLERFANVGKAIDLLVVEVTRIRAVDITAASDSDRLEARLAFERKRLQRIGLGTTREELNAILPDVLNSAGYWRFDQRSGDLAADGVTMHLLRPTCAPSATTCPAYEAQKRTVRVVQLVGRLGKYADNDALLSQYQDALLQDARWKAYFNDSLPQFWWEVAINGARMGEDLCPRDRTTGIQRGFCAVPSDQWIVLHPEAGLEWRSEAGKSDDLAPAFLVEVFGRYRWSWDGAQLHNRFGAALVAAYSNRQGVDDWSYGLMLHAGAGYNLAVTTTADGDVGVLLNLNLAERFFGRKQEYTDYLRALRRPSIFDVVMGNWPPPIPAGP